MSLQNMDGQMRFGTAVLGKPSHNALVKLQEYEIKLLEVIKKTVTLRIKCDKEYANSLAQIAMQGSKIEAPEYNSPLYDAWKEILHELTQAGNTLKKSSDLLQSSTYEKVVALIKDKTASKKYYTESRERIDNELLKVIHTELDKKQTQYQKLESDTAQAKKGYDTAVDKKNKIATIEKSQDKYRKATMKLFHSHNEYVLHVLESQMHQEQYRSTVLPELLDGMQHMEVQFVQALKDIIAELVQHTSPCREEFISCHKEVENRLRHVNPNTEYFDFIESKRTTLEPEAAIHFEALHGDGSNLPFNEISLNSLSLQGIEHLAQGYESDKEAISAQIEDHQNYLADLQEEIQQFSENISNLSLQTKQLCYVSTKLKLTEQECLNQRQQSLHYKLDQQLQDLGDREPPPGLILPDFDTISITSSHSDLKSPSTDSKFGFGKLKKAFTKRQKDDSTPSVIDFSKSVREQAWFHGAIPRTEAVQMVQADGDFLLRESNNTPGELVLTGRSDRTIRHFKVLPASDTGLYRFDDRAFDTILALIQHHYNNRIVVTQKTGCLLINPILNQWDKWQLSHDDLEMDAKLGQGNFGTVYKARMRTTNEWVAVKTCKETVDSNTKDKFLLEAKILKGYDHPNIVRLIGICTDKHPIYIVMELVTGGDLGKYLKKKKDTLSPRQLTQMCRDACAGLAYLEERKCIHRDVAARNCLITESQSVKITDFGMSREEEDGVYSVSGSMKQVPMKWTAPEAMNYGKFTSASDVWSFGILSWEIFSYGDQPYRRMTNQIAREQVEGGYRMPAPESCPDRYYSDVMRSSWEYDATRRPKFSELLRTTDTILKTL